MKIYKKYYEFVTDERTLVKVEVSEEMYVELRQSDFDFYNSGRTEFRRDGLATTEKFVKLSEEYAMSPENLMIYREWCERRERQSEQLPKLLEKLTPLQHEIIQSIFYDGLTQEETGKKYGVKQQTIFVLLKRIYAKLRKELI